MTRPKAKPAKTQLQPEKQPEKERPAHWFKPGQSGNPGGRPTGARNRLQGTFMNALADDFDAHGAQAIVDCREQNPAAYLKTIASLMPKELEIKRPLEDLTDDELDGAIALLREKLTDARDAGAGEAAAQSRKQTH